MEIHFSRRPRPRSRIVAALARVALVATLTVSLATPVARLLPAQRIATSSAPTVRWRIATPDAALAWYAVLADLRLPGAGAFAFTARGAAPDGDPELARALAASREFEILHFVPLYHPSADRATLAEAVRVAAGDAAPAPRATLLVGALRQALTPTARRVRLPALADALLAARPAPPDAERTAAWQALLDSLYVPALAPWLVAERLDEGRLIVAPAIGAEGRLFSATADRADNLVAVGSFSGDDIADAPLLAFARELCFPVVSRAAREARLRAEDPASARRASLAAVRCGAALLDRRLPARSAAYRRFWLRRLAETGTAIPIPAASDEAALRAAFSRAFASDALFDPAFQRAIGRLPPMR